MRRFLAASLLSAVCIAGLPGCVEIRSGGPALAKPARTVAADRPNVIVILADDLDWADVSTYGRADAHAQYRPDRKKRRRVLERLCRRFGLCRQPRRPADRQDAAAVRIYHNISDESDVGAGLLNGRRPLPSVFARWAIAARHSENGIRARRGNSIRRTGGLTNSSASSPGKRATSIRRPREW